MRPYTNFSARSDYVFIEFSQEGVGAAREMKGSGKGLKGGGNYVEM